MNSINEVFARCSSEDRAAMMPFITCGYPNMKRFEQLARTVSASGADIIEIGFPHSDPLADGPVIQRASHLAIKRGFTIERGFEALETLAAEITQPLVVMCYVNLILRMGVDRFVKACSKAGIRGLIVPDLTLEESCEIAQACDEQGVSLIYLVTPTTPPSRIARIAKQASGFIYFVSVTGTTGARAHLNGDLSGQIDTIRNHTHLPICVGFGISSPEMAAHAGAVSDGVIIGSKILQLVDQDSSNNGFKPVARFLQEVQMKLGART